MSKKEVARTLKQVNALLRAETEEDVVVTEPSGARLLDLAVFFATLDVVASETGSLDQEGARLARKYLPDFIANVEQLLGPVMEVPGFKSFRRGALGWGRLGNATAIQDKYMVARGRFIILLLSKMRGRQNLMADAFGKGMVLQSAKRLGNVADAETTAAKLEQLAYVKQTGAMTRTRLYVKKIITDMGVEVPAFDEAVGDVVVAQGLGAELRATEARLANAQPGTEEAETLKAEAAATRAEIEELAASSPSPHAVITTAATEAAKAATNYATETGRKNGLSPAQEEAMMVRGKSIIAAGAGSGKTRTLAAKVAYHINELGLEPGQIIATSFSKKSADELKAKVKRATGLGESIFDEPGSADGYGTTHSITKKICHRYLPNGGSLDVLENETSLLKKAMAQVCLSPTRPVGSPPPPVGFFDSTLPTTKTAEELPDPAEEALPPEMAQEAPLAPANDFQEVLQQAIEWWKDYSNRYDRVNRWGIKPDYRDKVVGFLGDLIRRGSSPSDLSQPQKDWLFGTPSRRGAGILPGAGITFDPRSALSGAADGAEIEAAGSGWYKNPANQWFNMGVGDKAWSDKARWPRPVGPRQVALFISNMKGKLITPSQAVAKYGFGMMTAAYGAYEWLKGNDEEFANKLTFDDMLIKASHALLSNRNALAQYQTRFRCILVDEAQDLNPAQHFFFGLVAGYIDPDTQKPREDGKMSADTFCFIGDDKQAIYEFRGAEPNEFIDLSTVHGFDTKLLETNYRSGGNIVDSANRLIAYNKKQIPMVCKPMDKKQNQGIVEYVDVPDNLAGAKMTAQVVRENVDNGTADYSDFGVACRTNAEIYDFVAECLKNRIPFKIPPNKFHVFSNPTSKAIINWMRFIAADPSDTRTINPLITELHRAPNFFLKDIFNQRMGQLARGQNFLDFLNNGGWSQIYNEAYRNRNVKTYLDALNFAQSLADREPGDIVKAVLHDIKGKTNQEGEWVEVSMAQDAIYKAKRDPEIMDMLTSEMETGSAEEKLSRITDDMIRDLALAQASPVIGLFEGYDDLSTAMAYLDELQNANKKLRKNDQDKEERESNAVAIDSIHGWKGLECKRIFVPMPAGTFPHLLSEGDEDAMASERRLAYVAITRGQEHVTVIAPEVNMAGKDAGPSQFVGEACIPPKGVDYNPEAMGAAPIGAALLKAAFSDAEIEEILREYEMSQGDLMDLVDPIADEWRPDLHLDAAAQAASFAELVLASLKKS